MRTITSTLCCLAALVLSSLPLWAADPVKPADPGTLIVIDANGKEQKLKTWKFSAGTRHLGWLTPLKEPKASGSASDGEAKESQGTGEKPAEADKPVGPEYLEMRELNSTLLQNGILTLIPLEQIRTIEFDNKEYIVTVTVATSEKAEDDVKLSGSTDFKGINKWAIECEVDKGELGLAEVKFLGGLPTGIKGIRFPTPKLIARPGTGRPATVTGNDEKKKSEHKVTDLQALYAVEGGQKLASTLFFKTTLKIDLAKIQKVVVQASKTREWDVTLKDGDNNTLTLLTQGVKLDDKPALLLGLVGKTSVGYKLFAQPAIAEIQFEEGK